ncbi:hypothetical protein [Actinoplanes friuliensis]|nr:hypothetical protein [Actinoplanes friuliensis]
MFKQWKKQWAIGRVKAGDGHPLKPFRWWQTFTGRKLFSLRVQQDGQTIEYAVEVRQGSERTMAHVFLNGRHHAQAPLPAVIPVAHGTIEIAKSNFGLKRASFVSDDNVEHQLVADPSSLIGRRLRYEREHPQASRIIGAVSIAVLLVGVGLNLIQLLEPLSAIPPVQERFGTFESPVSLPVWLNVALGAAAVLGSMERGLRLKYSWLLDGMAD